ncbi:MAG: MFS transporter [Tepidisphaeraceae bacterium]
MTQSTPALAAPSGAGLSVRLSVMMLLQYAVWGLWMPILAAYLGTPVAGGGLGFSSAQIGWILGTAGSLGAVAAPFIAGQAADRYLNAERALALLLLVGGGLNIWLASVTQFTPFLLVSVAYSIVYMPTLSLTNSIAFQNLDDPERRFPPIRLWGTAGWAAASTGFTWLWLNSGNDATNTHRIADALRLSGALSIAYAGFALFLLPATPPKKDGENPFAFLKAFALLRNRTFLLVTLVALPIAMIHQVYFIRAAPFLVDAVGVPKRYLGLVMGIGQASEAAFLLLLGMFIKRLGYKWVLTLGCLAYAVRFGIFALGTPPALVIASQALHGLCYGCFFAGSFLLVDKIATADIRHSAQTVFGIIILGVGPILASVYNGAALGQFDHAGGTQYGGVWGIESLVALGAAGVLVAMFRSPRPASAGVEMVEPGLAP